MPFIVYIIYSKVLDCYYVGHTANLQDRLFRHNNSGSKATKKAKDWILVHQEVFPTRAEAMAREATIKKQKSKSFIQQLFKKH